MQEIIISCFNHIKIGYFLFFLIFPFIYIFSVIFYKKGAIKYKISLLFFSLIYYLLLEIQHVEAFYVLIFLALINIIILHLIFLSRKTDISVFNIKLEKIFLLIGIFLNLVPLIFVKDYIKILGFDINSFVFLNIIGLSYFVFNAISLIVDFYKGVFKYYTPLDVFLYLFYFPKIMAGPLVRFKDFIEEANINFQNKESKDLYFGLFLICFGILKKWIADFIYSAINPVFISPESFSGGILFLSIYIYTLFIFLDFSGYTDIARGVSLLLGIRLPENFKSPYLSVSLKEFWRRWHITLYEWIKDYIYIGLLGGNRKGKRRTYINILTAFTFSGIWHGNYLNYILWGFLHGAGVILSSFFTFKKDIHRYTGWFITFNSVALLWVFFAITDFNNLYRFFLHIFTDTRVVDIASYLYFKPSITVLLLLGYFISFYDFKIKEFFLKFPNTGFYIVFNVTLFVFILILLNIKKTVSPFLYESF